MNIRKLVEKYLFDKTPSIKESFEHRLHSMHNAGFNPMKAPHHDDEGAEHHVFTHPHIPGHTFAVRDDKEGVSVHPLVPNGVKKVARDHHGAMALTKPFHTGPLAKPTVH